MKYNPKLIKETNAITIEVYTLIPVLGNSFIVSCFICSVVSVGCVDGTSGVVCSVVGGTVVVVSATVNWNAFSAITLSELSLSINFKVCYKIIEETPWNINFEWNDECAWRNFRNSMKFYGNSSREWKGAIKWFRIS